MHKGSAGAGLRLPRHVARDNLHCTGFLMYAWRYAWELSVCSRAHKIYKGGRTLRTMMLQEGKKPPAQLEDFRRCPAGMLELQPRTTPADANAKTG